ncbi:PfkB family carbohydrate kinase [Naumannella huperziae]
MDIGRFVVCGEALIDLLPAGGTPDAWFSTTWQATSAGGPMTTAIALRLLDQRASYLGRLSRDAFGQQLRQHLVENWVDLDLAVSTPEPTSLAVVSLDEQGRASYTFHFHDTANFAWRPEELPALEPTDWLHTGTLAAVVEPGASVLLDWARGLPGGISVDVNVRSSLIDDPAEYWRRIRPWLQIVGERARAGAGGMVKASDDDIRFLARGSGAAGDPEELMRGWVAEFGLDLGLLTLGPDGAVAVSATDAVRVPGRKVELVDTISAGDTFMAGFLSAHAADPADLTGALERAVAASALVVTRVGAQPPTLAEVLEFQRAGA